uniref:ribosomal protein S11 n=1 Tax=Hypnea flava TaxID=1524266 RepID=UPI0030018041|nr:ribosomal protein S11 [Hypnea flava]
MLNKNKLIILTVLFTWSNILYTVTKIDGDILFWSSVGTHKKSGTKKITSTAIFLSLKDLRTFLNLNNISYIFLKLKGFSKHKKVVLKYFKKSCPKIILIQENLNLPHNGCKSSKIRRF